MFISAFTYVRNGFTFGYPFIESIKSLLPLVDEYIIVIGDSNDGTREAVVALHDHKIKIIDTIWSDELRKGGKIFALQANIGLAHTNKNADWLFHLQADEVIHQNDFTAIKKAMGENIDNKKVDGFLLKFINFFGDYDHYGPSRRFHQREIRIIRNDAQIRSFGDSMGFRKFIKPADANEKGTKLLVKQIDATVYHYSWARPPKKQKAKHIEFSRRYEQTYDFEKEYEVKYGDQYDYRDFDYLKKFTGTHPDVMLQVVQAKDWNFKYDPRKNDMNFKEKLMKFLETVTGKQFFIYKNYKVLKN